jgi:hypothetical protein
MIALGFFPRAPRIGLLGEQMDSGQVIHFALEAIARAATRF